MSEVHVKALFVRTQIKSHRADMHAICDFVIRSPLFCRPLERRYTVAASASRPVTCELNELGYRRKSETVCRAGVDRQVPAAVHVFTQFQGFLAALVLLASDPPTIYMKLGTCGPGGPTGRSGAV